MQTNPSWTMSSCQVANEGRKQQSFFIRFSNDHDNKPIFFSGAAHFPSPIFFPSKYQFIVTNAFRRQRGLKRLEVSTLQLC